jgi:hypothetical protein
LIYDTLHGFALPFKFFNIFLEFYGFLGQIKGFALL